MLRNGFDRGRARLVHRSLHSVPEKRERRPTCRGTRPTRVRGEMCRGEDGRATRSRLLTIPGPGKPQQLFTNVCVQSTEGSRNSEQPSRPCSVRTQPEDPPFLVRTSGPSAAASPPSAQRARGWRRHTGGRASAACAGPGVGPRFTGSQRAFQGLPRGRSGLCHKWHQAAGRRVPREERRS